MSDAPSRKQDQYIVRLPEGMRDRIKAAAAANHRSMNAEIVGALEAMFPEPRESTAEDEKAVVNAVLDVFRKRGLLD